MRRNSFAWNRMVLAVTTLGALAIVPGCGEGHGDHEHDMGAVSAAPDDPNPDPNCQPINAYGEPDKKLPGECFLPFPSTYYEKDDPSTTSKWRVAIPTGVLPKNQVGRDFVPNSYNALDGWSPSSSLVANLKAHVDPAQLPKGPESIGDVSKIGETLEAASRVQLMDYATGERVAVWAELDANAPPSCQTAEVCGVGRGCDAGLCRFKCQDDSDCRTGGTCGAAGFCSRLEDQVVLVHPIARLKPATRYVAAFVGLVDLQGKPIAVKPFETLKSGQFASTSPLEKVRKRYDEIFAALDKAGVPKAQVTYAWDFVTGSNDQYTRGLVQMRNEAFARFDKEDLGSTYKLDDRIEDDPNNAQGWMFRLEGYYDVPNYLASTTDLYSKLVRDDKYMPKDTGKNYPALFHINVPMCAKDAVASGKKLPVIVYGHGLLGGPGEADGGVHQKQANANCMVYVATNWVGLSNADSGPITAKVFADWESFQMIPDRLHQGQLNFLVLAHWAATTMKNMKELRTNPDDAATSIIDGKEVWYYGISQGGIEGNILVALSPEIIGGVFGVGAGNYSFLITRSADFDVFDGVLSTTYPAHRDQALLLAISQNLWDFADPIAYGERLIKNPFPGLDGKPLPVKRVLHQESRHDAQVSNIGTHQLAREIGLSVLEPSNYAVYGLKTVAGPVESAYVQYDDSPRWKAPNNYIAADVNVPGIKDNPAHEAIRRTEAVRRQIQAFMKPDGKVTNFCDGKCDASAEIEWPDGNQTWN